MSKPRDDQRASASLLRKLTALKAQLPDRERTLLSSTIAAAMAAGVLAPSAAVPADDAVESVASYAGGGASLDSIRQQFDEAFTPGPIDEFGRMSVKLPD